MSFTGKATYTAGATLPEIAEDVSDLVTIASPHETPLLDALGDAARPARSTVHEWLEDALLPNSDAINDSTWSDALNDTTFVVEHGARFRAGDQIRVPGSTEMMLVTAVNTGTNTLTVVRRYGGTTGAALEDGQALQILGNAALEGDSADAARFTARSRVANYTQIFTSTVEVSGSELAVRQLQVQDEIDYQKQQRLRELLRDLENCVINGRSAAANPEGSATVRRTMKGALAFIQSNAFSPAAQAGGAGNAAPDLQRAGLDGGGAGEVQCSRRSVSARLPARDAAGAAGDRPGRGWRGGGWPLSGGGGDEEGVSIQG